jgi:hypothetical protein
MEHAGDQTSLVGLVISGTAFNPPACLSRAYGKASQWADRTLSAAGLLRSIGSRRRSPYVGGSSGSEMGSGHEVWRTLLLT